MAYLLDTNVLLRYTQPNDPDHPLAVTALDRLFDREEEVCLVVQNLIEFWNVATRPRIHNGLGLSVSQAQSQLQTLETIFVVQPEAPDIYPQWRRLVVTYGITGVQVHDTRLVAAMLIQGISHLLTFNARHFTRFEPEGLVVVHPQDVPE